jgi:hypothetical protein
MPRAKATDVVIHRIELGGKERELAEGVVAAFQFNRVASPVVAGMSDVSFMVTLGAILAIWFPEIILPTGAPTIEEVTAAIKDGFTESRDKINKEASERLEGRSEAEYVFDEGTLVGRYLLPFLRGFSWRGRF